jgi:hypothetical protein
MTIWCWRWRWGAGDRRGEKEDYRIGGDEAAGDLKLRAGSGPVWRRGPDKCRQEWRHGTQGARATFHQMGRFMY